MHVNFDEPVFNHFKLQYFFHFLKEHIWTSKVSEGQRQFVTFNVFPLYFCDFVNCFVP